MNLAQTNF